MASRTAGVATAVAALVVVLALVDARAVNISNTWVLPEDGFPVFYRYFRDRINWFEADAVCQFHHANLVTVDSGAQFDAARAFLRELDVVTPVWVGLKRARDQPHFLWTNEQPLSSIGYWNEPLPGSTEELCAAADPAADFRWHGLACGGLEVASFVCELPVPEWAAARDGCMLESLPSLTAAFLPEEAAVELTSDCGLGGTRRVVCKGNTTREALFAQLNCHNMMNEEATLGPGGADQPDQPDAADAEDADESVATGAVTETSGVTTPGGELGEQAEQGEQGSTRPRRATTTTTSSGSKDREATTRGSVDVDTWTPVSSTELSSEPSTVLEPVTESPGSPANPAGPASSPRPAGTTGHPTNKPTAPPAPPASVDTLIVARKDEKPAEELLAKTEKVATAAPEQPTQGAGQDGAEKLIIVPIVAKKGPTFPKKVSAGDLAKPFRPEKIPAKLRGAAPTPADKPVPKSAPARPVVEAVEAKILDMDAMAKRNRSAAVPVAAVTDDSSLATVQVVVPSSVEVVAIPPAQFTAEPKPVVVEVPKEVVPVDETDNKLDGADFTNHMAGDAADDLDDALMIRELSSARTPLIKALPVVDVPLVEPAPPAARGKETPDFLTLDDKVARRPPTKKDGLPAAIAGAAVTTTTTSTAAPATTVAPTASASGSATSTAAAGAAGTTGTAADSTASPQRLRESMAGPGGKARTLTTAPPLGVALAVSAASTTVAPATAAPAAPATSKAAPATTTEHTVSTAVPTAAAVMSSSTTVPPPSSTAVVPVSTSSPTSVAGATADPHHGANSTATATAKPEETTPKEGGRRRQHLPAPLLSMNMKPESEDGEEGMESEPQSPPRPNRNRSLVRQQHRSFYPYFLNRVLGR